MRVRLQYEGRVDNQINYFKFGLLTNFSFGSIF